MDDLISLIKQHFVTVFYNIIEITLNNNILKKKSHPKLQENSTICFKTNICNIFIICFRLLLYFQTRIKFRNIKKRFCDHSANAAKGGIGVFTEGFYVILKCKNHITKSLLMITRQIITSVSS